MYINIGFAQTFLKKIVEILERLQMVTREELITVKAAQWHSHVTEGIHWWVKRKILVILMEHVLLCPFANLCFHICWYPYDYFLLFQSE